MRIYQLFLQLSYLFQIKLPKLNFKECSLLHSTKIICFHRLNNYETAEKVCKHLDLQKTLFEDKFYDLEIISINLIQMTEQLLSESELLHNILIEETNRNISRINQIQNLSLSISQLFTSFTNSINISCRNLFKKLKYDEEEDPSIIFLSKFVVDMLGEMTKKFNLVNKKVKNQVIQPLEQFYESQKDSYSELTLRSAQLVTQIQANSSFLTQLTKNFRSNAQSELSKQQQEDFKKIFECQMKKCNENWHSIKKRYKKMLADTDSTNSFRCNFTVKMQVKICNLLNRLVNSAHVQETLTGYEQLIDQNQTLSIYIKQKIRDKMGKSILLQQKDIEELEATNQLAFKQKSMIDDFISIFTSFSNLKQDQTKHEKARSLILSNTQWSNYFLSRIRSNLHTQIKLPAIKYHQMTTIIKYLFATCVEQENNQQIIYHLIYIGYRMNYNGNYIIKELAKHNESFWEKNQRWYGLIQYLKNVRDQGLANKKNGRNQKFKKMVKNGLNWIAMNNPHKVSTEKKIRSEKIIADARAYDILCEMNYYMSRLELNQKFIFDFMVQASDFYGVSKQNTKKLLKFHSFVKQNQTTKINPSYLKRKKRIEQKYRNITKQKMIVICVGKCLPFLEANSKLLQLRMVNSLWAKQLRKKIGKRFLIQEKNEDIVNKIRISAYQGFCPSVLSKKIIQRMIEQMPSFTEHSDIILLDAKRSLAWDESLRQTLVTILKCYAFYHPNVGYLQGMNYLCQNILKLTDQKNLVYKIFQYLMNNQFYGMYSANFDGLRTKIYQFMRIVQIEKPKLYNHFQTQKLEGEHFILPWAITLWGEMSGDLCWVLWDGFISKGWKWWFKTMLWLINILEPELLNMNFEEMMKCFSELNTGLLNMNVKQLKDFGIDINRAKSQIDKISIHEDLLKQIQKQYKTRVQMINQYLRKLQTPKKALK